jgi:phage recombination protein Bet
MTMELQAPQGHTMMVMGEKPAAMPLVFTEEQRQMIRDSFAGGASDEEFAVLMEIAKARRLNPLLKQVHFVARWDSQKGREVWSTQVSIDGLRAIAERTGIYAGQDEPEFIEGPDGALKACKVKVYRKDWERPAVGVAYFAEYVQTRFDKKAGRQVTSSFWQRMPHTMLAKCAESLALRKAFPEDTSGLYTPEEMGQADNDRPEVIEAPAPAPRRADVRRVDADRVRELAGENPDLGEHNRAVEEAQAEADAAGDLINDLEVQVARCGTVNALADLWISCRADVVKLPKGMQARAWKKISLRADAIGSSAAAVRAEVQRRDGPQGPNGGRKPTAPGEAASARGDGTEGTAANDSSPVNGVRVVSDAAQSIIERHGANLWGLRGAMKKHREELLPGDVPELAKVLARLDVDPLTGAHLAPVAAERAVCTLTGLRRVA